MNTRDQSQISKDERIKQKRFITTSGLAKHSQGEAETKSEDVKEKLDVEPSQKRPSIFAQRLAARKVDTITRNHTGSSPSNGNVRASACSSSESNCEIQKIEEIKAAMQSLGMIESSQIVSGTDVSVLREQVLRSLQPKNIEFMLSRKKRAASATPDASRPSKCEVPLGKLADRPVPVALEPLKNFPNMQVVEHTKLEWMQNSEESGNIEPPGAGETEGRFDRNGELLSLKKHSDSTWIQGLHHHEQEMEKPGYTLEEYVHYARSTNSAQRNFALNAMAAIFRNAHYGLYEKVLFTTPLSLLCNVDVVSAVRVAMDNDDMVSLDSASSCLAAMIYPDAEEESFDVISLFPSSQPCLLLKVLKEDSAEISASDPKFRDHQILSNDLLDFLVFRSHILLRIKYLLSSRCDRLSTSSEISILKILIRIARHSPIELMRESSILKQIGDQFISTWTRICERPNCLDIRSSVLYTTCNSHSVLTWLSLKLFRVLSESSFSNALSIKSQLHITKPVLSYIIESSERYDVPCQHGCLLLLESFRLWSTFVQHGIALDEFSEVFPSCVATLRSLRDKEVTKFDAYYGAYVMLLLNRILQRGAEDKDQKYEKAQRLVEREEALLLSVSFKFLNILSSSVLKDCELPLCGQCLCYLSFLCRRDEGNSKFRVMVSNAAKSWTLREVFKKIIPSSLILSSFREGINYPSNVIFTSAIQSPGEPIAVVGHSSPFLLLSRYLKLLDSLNGEDPGTYRELSLYVDKLSRNLPFKFCRSFFVKFELEGLCSLIQFIPNEKLLMPFLLQLPCLLSKRDIKFFRLILQKVVTKAFSSVDLQESVMSLYSICYFPNIDSEGNSSKNTELKENVILFESMTARLVSNKFWIFDPLRRLCVRYMGKREDLKLYFDHVLNEVKTCLIFIQETLTERSMFSDSGDLVTVYALVTQVFLLGEDVLVDPEVQTLMRLILRKYLSLWSLLGLSGKQYSGFKPGPEIPYILRFEDYYKDLVLEFESTSFANDTFAAYLMIPLRAEESTELKLIFWSMSGIRFVKLSEENELVSLSFLLSEREKDKTLHRIYSSLLGKNSVISEKMNPFLFQFLRGATM